MGTTNLRRPTWQLAVWSGYNSINENDSVEDWIFGESADLVGEATPLGDL